MFPQGGPGIALLLLRVSVPATFVISEANRFGMPTGSGQLIIAGGGILLSISLVIGFLTPILSVIVCVTVILSMVLSPSSNLLLSIFCVINAVALTLLGPGAYSVDAQLFGRRVTVVHPRKDKNRD